MNKILQFSIFILLFTAIGIFVSGTMTITDSFINITNGTGYLNLNGQNRFSITGYNVSGNNINWTDLISYPVACPDETYLTQLGDSITCTAVHGNLSVVNITANYFYGDGRYIQNSTPIIVFSTDGTGDYNCILTDDCATKINSVIQTISITGGRLFFDSGVYNINSTI